MKKLLFTVVFFTAVFCFSKERKEIRQGVDFTPQKKEVKRIERTKVVTNKCFHELRN